jgi:hypothetical protein
MDGVTMVERSVRGSVINAYFKFVEKKWGKQGLDACIADIGLSEEVKDGLYYPDAYRENVLRWIERTYGRENIVEAGKFVVKNLGLLGWLVRYASLKVLAESFPKNYSEVYTFGQVRVDASLKERISMKLYDVNRVDISCDSWLGVCEGALEMTRTKGKVSKTRCQLKGDVYCEYIIDYGK